MGGSSFNWWNKGPLPQPFTPADAVVEAPSVIENTHVSGADVLTLSVEKAASDAQPTKALSAEQEALVDAVINGTSGSPPRLFGLPVYIKGLGPAPTGAYVELEPTVAVLRRLGPADLASVVNENDIFGDTDELRALAATLDMDSLPGLFAASYLKGPNPNPNKPKLKPSKPPRSGGKAKVIKLSLADAFKAEEKGVDHG